jgi:hypothetical protein
VVEHSLRVDNVLTLSSWSGAATCHWDCCMEEQLAEEIEHVTKFSKLQQFLSRVLSADGKLKIKFEMQ